MSKVTLDVDVGCIYCDNSTEDDEFVCNECSRFKQED